MQKECSLYIIHLKTYQMQKIVKQVCGIDVAKKELVASLGRMYDDLRIEVYSFRSFSNDHKGFTAMVEWVKASADPLVAVQYVMEATGVYHESAAYFLAGQQAGVSIVLPNKISNYMRTLTIKTITDKTSSEAITRFGLERKMCTWAPPSPVYKKLRQLTRERDQLVQNRTMIKNQLHAEQSEAEPNKGTIIRIKKQVAFLDKQEQEIKSEIAGLVNANEGVKQKVKLISSIPGIALLSAATILAETNGFELIRNKKQLSSYAGLDVKEKQSGTSVKGKSRISKKGNKYLRKAMHMPALCAIRHDERFKAIFARLVAKHGIKMKAAVAIQRKMLELTYTIFKTQKTYDKKYLQKIREQHIVTP